MPWGSGRRQGRPTGTFQRVFVYDSLSRLTSACNPESGTIAGNNHIYFPTGYAWDNNGNLKTRTDGEGRTLTLLYDALNRLTDKQYSDYAATNPTPWPHYAYQGVT